MASYVSTNDDIYKGVLSAFQGQADALNALYSQNNNQYVRLIEANKGIGESDKLAIAQKFTRDRAAAGQALTNRGLANSSVQLAANRGINLDEANANLSLSDALARRAQALELEQIGARERYGNNVSGILGMSNQFQAGRYGALEQGAQNYHYQSALMDDQARLQREREMRLAGMAGGGFTTVQSPGGGPNGPSSYRQYNPTNSGIEALASAPPAYAPAFSGISDTQTIYPMGQPGAAPAAAGVGLLGLLSQGGLGGLGAIGAMGGWGPGYGQGYGGQQIDDSNIDYSSLIPQGGA